MELVIDIETVGKDFDELASSQQEYLLRYAEKELNEELRLQKIEDAKRYLSLYPFTAKTIVIGFLRTDTENAFVLYEDATGESWEKEEGRVKYLGCTEKEMLEKFWDYVSKASRLITFNGNHFDLAFLTMRSAILKIKPTVDLLKKQSKKKFHIDLLDEFTLHNKIRKFNLDFYCKAFGISSPKDHGITGMEVKELYKANKTKEIATYCFKDVEATFELYKIWRDYLNF